MFLAYCITLGDFFGFICNRSDLPCGRRGKDVLKTFKTFLRPHYIIYNNKVDYFMNN